MLIYIIDLLNILAIMLILAVVLPVPEPINRLTARFRGPLNKSLIQRLKEYCLVFVIVLLAATAILMHIFLSKK